MLKRILEIIIIIQSLNYALRLTQGCHVPNLVTQQNRNSGLLIPSSHLFSYLKSNPDNKTPLKDVHRCREQTYGYQGERGMVVG